MRRFILALALIAFWIGPAVADDVFVNGYFKNNGTYVQPHYRSAPDGNTLNNWSTQGNINPYTGQSGTKNPYAVPSYSYGGTSPYPVAPLKPTIRYNN